MKWMTRAEYAKWCDALAQGQRSATADQWQEQCAAYSRPSAECFCNLRTGHRGAHYCPCCRRWWADR